MLPKVIILIFPRGGFITGNLLEGRRRLQPANMRKLKLAATPAQGQLVTCKL
jgi:hypothetical protein